MKNGFTWSSYSAGRVKFGNLVPNLVAGRGIRQRLDLKK